MKITLSISLFFLCLILPGCYTYYPSRESPDSLKIEQNVYRKILKFNMDNGNTIDVSDNEVKYYDKYKSYEKVFIYTQSDTIVKSQNPDSIKIKTVERIIPSEKIKSVTVERRKTDAKSTAYTTLIIIGSAALLFFITFTIFFHSNSDIKL